LETGLKVSQRRYTCRNQTKWQSVVQRVQDATASFFDRTNRTFYNYRFPFTTRLELTFPLGDISIKLHFRDQFKLGYCENKLPKALPNHFFGLTFSPIETKKCSSLRL
jgi:hypothetical protein